jgi:hypothetical protein
MLQANNKAAPQKQQCGPQLAMSTNHGTMQSSSEQPKAALQ